MYGFEPESMTDSQRRYIVALAKKTLETKQQDNLLEIIDGFNINQARSTIQRLKRLENSAQ